MCSTLCNKCLSRADSTSCALFATSPQCRNACPSQLEDIDQPFETPLAPTLNKYTTGERFSSKEEPDGQDEQIISYNNKKQKREFPQTPSLRALVEKEDQYLSDNYQPPRHVPIGFADRSAPMVNPYDYISYNLSGWRVAIPREHSTPENILQQIYKYGPSRVGYVRVGDTLVPEILTPGERQTLVQSL